VSDQSEADFLRDQLAALLASPTLARVAERHSDANGALADFDEAGSEQEFDRETEPNIDAQMLRDALRAGLNK